MAGLLNWLKKTTVQLVDPERQKRVADASKAIEGQIRLQQKSFSLLATAERLGLTDHDRQLASLHLYSTVLGRAWKDGEITAGEHKFLVWLESALLLDQSDVLSLRQQYGHAVFESTLAAAFDDGVIDDAEADRLAKIAAALQTSVSELLATYFRRQGERFLRAVFTSIVASGQLEADGWKRLLDSVKKIGISEHSLLAIIEPEATRLVEHVLADAKSDGVLSPDEDQTIQRLISMLRIENARRRYIEQEVAWLRQLTQIKSGQLPSLPNQTAVQLRAGEILHYYGPVRYAVVRQLKSGPRRDVHSGAFAITDCRIVFSGETSVFTVRHQNVIEIHRTQHGVHLQCEGKGTGLYSFGDSGSQDEFAYQIHRVAIGRLHQTIVQKENNTNSRHIPREVRQRIWQRYGGRCAECEASDYLEFDHIVPVARGGSNSDNNVQLLCRRCNLKKSDSI